MTYKATFVQRYRDCEKTLRVLLSATSFVKNDISFSKILYIILAVGNYINGGTNRGQSYGFTIPSLGKLSEVKSPKNPQINLMHILGELLSEEYEELLRCFDEFDAVHASAAESLSDLNQHLNTLKEGLTHIQNQLNSVTCDETFKEIMGDWEKKAAKTIKILIQNHEKIQIEYKELLEYFGESATTSTEDFFGLLSKFAKELQGSIVQNRKRKEEELKAEQLNLKRTTHREKPMRDKEVASILEGEFDKIFSQLKNGSLLRQASVYKLARPSQIVAIKKQEKQE